MEKTRNDLDKKEIVDTERVVSKLLKEDFSSLNFGASDLQSAAYELYKRIKGEAGGLSISFTACRASVKKTINFNTSVAIPANTSVMILLNPACDGYQLFVYDLTNMVLLSKQNLFQNYAATYYSYLVSFWSMNAIQAGDSQISSQIFRLLHAKIVGSEFVWYSSGNSLLDIQTPGGVFNVPSNIGVQLHSLASSLSKVNFIDPNNINISGMYCFSAGTGQTNIMVNSYVVISTSAGATVNLIYTDTNGNAKVIFSSYIAPGASIGFFSVYPINSVYASAYITLFIEPPGEWAACGAIYITSGVLATFMNLVISMECHMSVQEKFVKDIPIYIPTNYNYPVEFLRRVMEETGATVHKTTEAKAVAGDFMDVVKGLAGTLFEVGKSFLPSPLGKIADYAVSKFMAGDRSTSCKNKKIDLLGTSTFQEFGLSKKARFYKYGTKRQKSVEKVNNRIMDVFKPTNILYSIKNEDTFKQVIEVYKMKEKNKHKYEENGFYSKGFAMHNEKKVLDPPMWIVDYTHADPYLFTMIVMNVSPIDNVSPLYAVSLTPYIKSIILRGSWKYVYSLTEAMNLEKSFYEGMVERRAYASDKVGAKFFENSENSKMKKSENVFNNMPSALRAMEELNYPLDKMDTFDERNGRFFKPKVQPKKNFQFFPVCVDKNEAKLAAMTLTMAPMEGIKYIKYFEGLMYMDEKIVEPPSYKTYEFMLISSYNDGVPRYYSVYTANIERIEGQSYTLAMHMLIGNFQNGHLSTGSYSYDTGGISTINFIPKEYMDTKSALGGEKYPLIAITKHSTSTYKSAIGYMFRPGTKMGTDVIKCDSVGEALYIASLSMSLIGYSAPGVFFGMNTKSLFGSLKRIDPNMIKIISILPELTSADAAACLYILGQNPLYETTTGESALLSSLNKIRSFVELGFSYLVKSGTKMYDIEEMLDSAEKHSNMLSEAQLKSVKLLRKFAFEVKGRKIWSLKTAAGIIGGLSGIQAITNDVTIINVELTANVNIANQLYDSITMDSAVNNIKKKMLAVSSTVEVKTNADLSELLKNVFSNSGRNYSRSPPKERVIQTNYQTPVTYSNERNNGRNERLNDANDYRGDAYNRNRENENNNPSSNYRPSINESGSNNNNNNNTPTYNSNNNSSSNTKEYVPTSVYDIVHGAAPFEGFASGYKLMLDIPPKGYAQKRNPLGDTIWGYFDPDIVNRIISKNANQNGTYFLERIDRSLANFYANVLYLFTGMEVTNQCNSKDLALALANFDYRAALDDIDDNNRKNSSSQNQGQQNSNSGKYSYDSNSRGNTYDQKEKKVNVDNPNSTYTFSSLSDY